jgi:hypothetical protein
MTHKEVLARITDHDEGVLASFEVREFQAHLESCDHCRTNFGQSRQLSTALGKISNPSPLATIGKLKLSTTFRDQPFARSRSMMKGPREIAAVTVRVAVLVGIIWFALMWTGVAVPTHKSQGYAVDFSRQPFLRGGASLPSSLPTIIPRARLDLAIHLGLRDQPGPYDVVLVQDGMRYASALGYTKLENHEPILRAKLDLGQVPAGESRLGIRPAGSEWRYYKVILKSTQ